MYNKKYCLVLSGGGAKGIYHLGVWKALQELEVEFEAIIGNSVGALVAGFLIQEKYETLDKIMSNMNIDDFVYIPKKLLKNGNINIKRDNLKLLKVLRESISKNGGIDTEPLKNILEDNLDEEKIRKSGIDLGVVTFHVNNIEPVEIFIDEMKEGTVLKYLQASATLPGFKTTKIEDKDFIDGGVYNNIPFSTAKARGYKNIVVVDISGAGWNKRPDIKGTNTIYIKNSIDMGGILDFSSDFLRKYKKLGYLDTLKVFDKVEGERYFFDSDPELYDSLEDIMMNDDNFKEFIEDYLIKIKHTKKRNYLLNIKTTLPKEMRHAKKVICALADCAAYNLNLEQVERYNFKEFIKEIYKKSIKVEENIGKLKKRLTSTNMLSMVKEIKSVKDDKKKVSLRNKPIYYYDLVMDDLLGSYRSYLSFASLDKFYPGVYAGKIFIEILRIYFSD